MIVHVDRTCNRTYGYGNCKIHYYTCILPTRACRAFIIVTALAQKALLSVFTSTIMLTWVRFARIKFYNMHIRYIRRV